MQTFRLVEHSAHSGEEQVTQTSFSTPYPNEQEVQMSALSEQVRQFASEQTEQDELGFTPYPVLQEVQRVMLE